MGKAWMPLNNFKKVREDNQKATLRHPDGHEITLAKSILSPHMKAQLAGLQMHQEPAPQKLAKGGRVKLNQGGGFFDFINNPIGGETTPGSTGQKPPASQPQAQDAGQADQGAGSASGQQQQFTQPSVNPSMAPVAGAPGLAGMPSFAGMRPDKMYQQGYAQERKGINEQAGAEAGAAIAKGNAAAAFIDHTKATMQAVQANTDQMTKDVMAFKDDVLNSRIDPSQYWNSKSDFQKTTTAVGLILGGIGGGLTGNGRNMALEFLNRNIDRNIQAQMDNYGQKKTLLEANMNLYKDKQIALQATHAMLTGSLEAEFIKAGSKSQSQLAAAERDKALGELSQNTAASIYGSHMAMQKGTVSIPGPDGRASGQTVYVPDAASAQKMRETYAKYGGALGILNQLQDSYKSGPTASPDVMAKREALHNGMAAAIGQTPSMRNAEVVKRLMELTDKSTLGRLTGIHSDTQFNAARQVILSEMNSNAQAYAPEANTPQFNPSGAK